MTATAWIIDKDHIEPDEDDKFNEVGTMGPSDAPSDLIARLKKGEGVTFKMYDDDGELYYTGRILSFRLEGKEIVQQTFEDCDEDFFRPLWDFGTPNAGAVDIRYRGPNGWESL